MLKETCNLFLIYGSTSVYCKSTKFRMRFNYLISCRFVRDPRAIYLQSWKVLEHVKFIDPTMLIEKTSIMLGLGKTDEQVMNVLKSLYFQDTKGHHTPHLGQCLGLLSATLVCGLRDRITDKLKMIENTKEWWCWKQVSLGAKDREWGRWTILHKILHNNMSGICAVWTWVWDHVNVADRVANCPRFCVWWPLPTNAKDNPRAPLHYDWMQQNAGNS